MTVYVSLLKHTTYDGKLHESPIIENKFMNLIHGFGYILICGIILKNIQRIYLL
jgi:hypothetical protein